MKKFFITSILTLTTLLASAVGYQPVMVTDDGKLANPKNFVEKNNIVSNEVICVRVDTFRGGVETSASAKAFYWCDAELKVLDKYGSLLYFATTSYSDVIVYHCPEGKETEETKHIDNTWDSNCKIFYYIAGTKYAKDGLCANPKQEHEVSETQQESIGAREKLQKDTYISNSQNHPITAIEFFPNLNGTINGKSIRDIFLNPENSVIVSRKNRKEKEITSNGSRCWRPVIPQYYKR